MGIEGGFLEYKCRRPLHTRQDRGVGIEKWTISKVMRGSRHDLDPGRLPCGKNPDQPPPHGELLVKAFRRDLGGPIKDDDIVRRLGRLSGRRGGRDHGHIGHAQACQNVPGFRGQRRITFGGDHLGGQLCRDRGGIPRRAADHQHAIGCTHTRGLEHLCDHDGLNQVPLDASTRADVDIEVEIGKALLPLRHERFTRNRQHGVDDAQIRDIAGTNLSVDHLLSRVGKACHQRGSLIAFVPPASRVAPSLRQRPEKRNMPAAGNPAPAQAPANRARRPRSTLI